MRTGIWLRPSVLAIVSCVSLAASAAELFVYKVGVILPLSGPLAAEGKAALEGIRMRVDEINAKGGVKGDKLELAVSDTRGDPQGAALAYLGFTRSKAICVLGPTDDASALALRQRDCLRWGGPPLISPSATGLNVIHGNHLYRACVGESNQAHVIAKHAAKETRKAAIFIDSNSQYCKTLASAFKASYEAAGSAVVAQEKYLSFMKETAFGDQIKRIKESGAEIVFAPATPELPLFIRQAREAGMTARLCGTGCWNTEAILNGSGDGIANALVVGQFSAADKRPAAQSFVAAFKTRTGHAPGPFEAMGYDCVGMLLEALNAPPLAASVKKTDSDDLDFAAKTEEVDDMEASVKKQLGRPTADSVRANLRTIKGLDAATGRISVTADGDTIREAVVLKVVKDANDKFTTGYVATVSP